MDCGGKDSVGRSYITLQVSAGTAVVNLEAVYEGQRSWGQVGSDHNRFTVDTSCRNAGHLNE